MDKVMVEYDGLHQKFIIHVKNYRAGDGYSFTVPLESLAELAYNRNPEILRQIVLRVHAHATKRAFEMRRWAGERDALFDMLDDLSGASNKIEELESSLEIAVKEKDWHYERVLQLHKENEELKRRLEELESTSHWVDKVIAMGGDVPMKEGTTEHDMLVKAFTALEEAKKLEEDARKDPKLV